MCKRWMCTLLALAVILSLFSMVPFEVRAETEPETEATELATEAAEPVTEASEPATAPTESVTEPSEGETDPTEEEEQSMKLSLEAEKLLKQYEGFRAKPYWDYSQWSVGWGTSYDMKDHDRYMSEGISVEEADGLLWGHIHSKSAHILKVTEAAGITLTQNQFDALVLFTYNVGTRWMYEADSEILDAVINGASDNEFIYAMVLWSKADRVVSDGLVRRRLAEANMYLNGVYSRTVPDNYSFVRFDANGGTVDYTLQGYDANQPVEIFVNIKPTYQDSNGDVYNFVGWFTEPSGGQQVTALDGSLGYGVHLYAHWEYSHNEPLPENPEDVVPADGIWGTVAEDVSVLNIRAGAGTNYTIVGSYRGGTRVLILEKKLVGSTYWGRTDKGWISLDYVTLDQTEETPSEPTAPPETDPPETEPPATEPPATEPPATEPPATEPPATEPPATEPPATEPPATEPPETQPPVNAQMGTIVVDPRLRIRSGAGTGYQVVGYYYNGDRVAILETTDVDGVLWGRTDKGWVSMEYVVLDSEAGETEPTEPPATEPPATEPPVTDPPATQPPVTEPPATQPPVTEPPATEPSATEPPATEPPATEPSETQQPTTPNTTGPWTGEVLTSGRLRIRSGAGSGYEIVGYLFDGDAVTVTQIMRVGNQNWGKIENGWICLDEVYLDGSENYFETATMTVASSSLRVRDMAGLGNAVIGYLSYGAKVQILDQITVDNHTWVCTQYGWVNLKYLK